MNVTIRKVDLSQRIAFDNRIAAASSSTNLQRMLDEMDRVKGSRITNTTTDNRILLDNVVGSSETKSKITDNPCRISPSPNHMKILEYLHGYNNTNGNGDNNSNIGGGGNVDNSKRKGNSRVVRQLQWNAACSIDADPWFDGHYYHDNNDNHTTNNNTNDWNLNT